MPRSLILSATMTFMIPRFEVLVAQPFLAVLLGFFRPGAAPSLSRLTAHSGLVCGVQTFQITVRHSTCQMTKSPVLLAFVGTAICRLHKGFVAAAFGGGPLGFSSASTHNYLGTQNKPLL